MPSVRCPLQRHMRPTRRNRPSNNSARVPSGPTRPACGPRPGGSCHSLRADRCCRSAFAAGGWRLCSLGRIPQRVAPRRGDVPRRIESFRSDSPTTPSATLNDSMAFFCGMTRDHQRDLEAQGGVTVARYCNLCGRSIPIEDQRTEARDWAEHVAWLRRRREDRSHGPRPAALLHCTMETHYARIRVDDAFHEVEQALTRPARIEPRN